MALPHPWLVPIILSVLLVSPASAVMTTAQDQDKPATASAPQKSSPEKNTVSPKTLSPSEELQQTINDAGNDRAALVRNLEAYLLKYPESPQRPQIYRALVEATLQLQDTAHAADYAERVVALTPG